MTHLVPRRVRAAMIGLSAAALFALAACGGGNSSSGSGTASGSASGGSTGSAQAGNAVTLTFWNGFTGGDRPGVQHLVDQFNAQHTDVKISMQIMPWDVFYQKLLPSYGAGQGPDLTAMDSNQLPVYAAKGVFQPLDDVFSNGLDKNAMVKGGLDAGMYQGKQYGIPANFTPILLYYNKKLTSAAGITTPPTNWTEWIADLKKLTKGGGTGGKPSQYGLSLGVHDTIEVMPILMWGNGGGIVSSDGKSSTVSNAASAQAVQTWSDLIVKNKISPVGLSGEEADKVFTSGKAGMEVNGPWLSSSLKQAGIDYGVAMVPSGPKATTTLADSVQFSLSAKADDAKKKAAMEFMSYWNSVASQQYFAGATGFPPTRSDVPQSALASNPTVATFAKYADKGQTLLPGNQNFAQIQNEIFDPAMQKILNGADVSSTLDGANKQISPLLGGS